MISEGRLEPEMASNNWNKFDMLERFTVSSIVNIQYFNISTSLNDSGFHVQLKL